MSQVGARNLARLAEVALERLGDYPSLHFEGTWHNSAVMWGRGARLAGGLIDHGIEPGDRVVVFMENQPDVPVIYHAVARAGAVIVPAIFLLTSDELARVISDSGAKAAITSPAFRQTVADACKEAPSLQFIISVGEELEALESFDSVPIVPRGDDDLAALVYTGGTTGRSKGVMLTHANLWEAGRAGHRSSYVSGLKRSLVSLPLSHSYGLLVYSVSMHADEQVESVLMRWFDATSWLQLAQLHKTQIAAVVPSMIELLLEQPLEEYDLSDLRYVVSGAAPLRMGALEAFSRRVPGVEVREGYGLTESAAVCSANPPGAVKRGSVGLPLEGTEIRLVDDSGNEVSSSEPGEILIRSDLVMAGYWNDPELTKRTIEDGWLHTGDIGRLDSDGYLSIVDRKKDLIIRGGFNVFPHDVEQALLEHDSVEAACVLGRPDELHGEEVLAFVVISKGAEVPTEELLSFAKQRLGGYKYPREIHVLPSLPLTLVGKVDRKALRALLTKEGVTA